MDFRCSTYSSLKRPEYLITKIHTKFAFIHLFPFAVKHTPAVRYRMIFKLLTKGAFFPPSLGNPGSINLTPKVTDVYLLSAVKNCRNRLPAI